MKEIKIYTLNYCPYCKKALQTLKKQDVEFENIDSTDNIEETSKMLKDKYNIEGDVTFPQIIVDGVRIGGNDRLEEIIKNGEFEKLFK